MRISNSFSEGEIQVLDFVLSTLLRGGSAQMATRSKDFASLCRKVHAMKAKVVEKKAEGARPSAPPSAPEPAVPAASSVGTVGSPRVDIGVGEDGEVADGVGNAGAFEDVG